MRLNARTAAACIAFNALGGFAGCKAASFAEDASSTADAGDGDAGPHDVFDATLADGGSEGDATLGDGTLGSPTPASIFGTSLSLWLDGSDATTIAFDSTARVVAWTDRSPKKEKTEMFYPRDTDRAEVVLNAVHGHPAVRMKVNPVGSAPILHTDCAYGSDDFILTMIVSYVATGRADLYLQDGQGGPELIADENGTGTTKITGNFFPATLETAKGGWNDGAFHVVTLRRVGGNVLVLRVDGTEATVTIDPALTSGPGTNEIGAHYTTGPQFIGATFYFNGSIAEIVRAYTGGTPAQMTDFSAYIATKYGLTF